jgi:hypothetical protein
MNFVPGGVSTLGGHDQVVGAGGPMKTDGRSAMLTVLPKAAVVLDY